MSKRLCLFPAVVMVAALVGVLSGVFAYSQDDVTLPPGYQIEELSTSYQYRGLPGVVFQPRGILVHPNGDVFIAATGEHRIYRVKPNGDTSVLVEILTPNALVLLPDDTLLVSQSGWGTVTHGTDQGTISRVPLSNPSAIEIFARVIDCDGMAFDSRTNSVFGSIGADDLSAIYRYSLDGTQSVFASTLPHFGNPDDLAVDSQGNIYVVDGSSSDKVLKFDVRGNMTVFATGLGPTSAITVRSDEAGETLFIGGREGVIYEFTLEGEWKIFATGLGKISGLAFAPDGTLYVCHNDSPTGWWKYGRVMRIFSE